MRCCQTGDLYKYLLASVEGSLATKSLINGSWSSWAYYALKSDLFAVNWITNPNTCATPFSVVNGWSHDLANVPDDAKTLGIAYKLPGFILQMSVI